jgi:hypothetical protein
MEACTGIEADVEGIMLVQQCLKSTIYKSGSNGTRRNMKEK